MQWRLPLSCSTYNQGDVILTYSSRFGGRSTLLLWMFAALLALSCAAGAGAQVATADASSADGGTTPGRGRILLVLPFDNLTDPAQTVASGNSANPAHERVGGEQANLDWIREAAPEILNSRFTSAGYLPLNREDRLYALDHLGLPGTFEPSRATALRLAETLDADSIVFGSFTAKGSTLILRARIVDVAKLHLSEEITETGEISKLIPLLNALAWKLTRKLDPGFSVAEETFRVAGSKLRLDAFEQYIRGLTERETEERLRHLKKATELSPDFTEAWLAAGRLQFANQQFEQAAVSFGKVTRGDPAELEAGFYRGLALIFSGNYPRAEESFAAVARVLPLPEVVNNEAVAISRRGRDGVALFRQAQAADPTDVDYRFNLAVSLHRHGDKAEALWELAECLKLKGTDSEAKALEAAWKNPAPSAAEKAAESQAPEPLERIKRSYDGAAFRQAALMLDLMEAARLQALPAPERAARLSRTAQEKLDRGLLLEAERSYQAALAADDHSAVAHAGLAEVRERAGDAESARKEAHAAIDRQPNLAAYLVLARLDLAANHLIEARDEAAEALRLDGTNRAAKDLRRTIELRLDSEPKSSSTSKPEVQAKPL